MQKRFGWIALGLAAVVLLTACSSSRPGSSQSNGSGSSATSSGKAGSAAQYTIDGRDVTQLYEAAKKEGKVSYYGGGYPVEQVNPYVEEFKKKFPGIEVEVFRSTTPAVLERFLTEARAGKHLADVIYQGDPYSLRATEKEGMLEEYDLASADKYPAALRPDKYVYPHSVVYVGPAYNSNLVKGDDEKKLQTDWKFLLDPKWKGKLTISVPEAGGTSYGPVYMFLGEKRSQFGPDFIKGLKANIGKVNQTTNGATADVAAGEYAIHVHGQTPATGSQIAQGAPIRIAFPAPTPAIPVGAAIAKGAPHPNAAKLFFEWSFSKEGQEKMVEIMSTHSGRTDVTADPFAKYDWYKKPTELWATQDLDAYLKGQGGDLANEWHTIMGTKK